MHPCKITIVSTEEDRETKTVRDGEMQVCGLDVALSYKDTQAAVKMIFQGERVEIIRQGDYCLHLFLEKGKILSGELGIGGSTGEIKTFAHKIIYSVRGGVVMALLHYDLIISGEKQEMHLRLSAQG